MRKHVLAAIAALTLLASAHADIAAFNAAVTAGNYKAAAAEAAATWPTLDKSRDDIRVIAREFGFAAYMAGDYTAAKTFAAAAAPEADPQSLVLLRTADHRLAPSDATRTQLADAISARSAMPGLDRITATAIDTLIRYDVSQGDWKDAQSSTRLGVKFMIAGGSTLDLNRRRYELFSHVADYMADRTFEAWEQTLAMETATRAEIDAAPSLEAAQKLAPIYWEISSWEGSMQAHLLSTKATTMKTRGKKTLAGLKDDTFSPRLKTVLDDHDSKMCPRDMKLRKIPPYPSSAMFNGFVGSVVLQMDLDDDGHANNPHILAAVPEKVFGDAVLGAVKDIRYSPGKGWNPSACTMAERNHVMTFVFTLGQ